MGCVLLVAGSPVTNLNAVAPATATRVNPVMTAGVRAPVARAMQQPAGVAAAVGQEYASEPAQFQLPQEASSPKNFIMMALGGLSLVSVFSYLLGRSSAPKVAMAATTGRRSMALEASSSQRGRWRGMDADMDMSDDQQDIGRGAQMVDPVFRGWAGSGTHEAVMSSQDYTSQAQRKFDPAMNNTFADYYISKSFYNKMVLHITKNFMDIPRIKVPLILGIWGGKGQGKTFQSELVYRKLGISPIVMSAGELESGNAGEPAKLVRQRYREAADIIKKGNMCSLFINDLDAGAGRMGGGTQYTVNNQMVNATLMNIADNPTNVQLPGVYKKEEIKRVPIVCTGNDFSTLYAPLIRDGRMEKFYWNPTREDRIGVCCGIFKDDPISGDEVAILVDTFPGQSIDFFGSLRSRIYDDAIWEYVTATGVENLNKNLVNTREPPKMAMPQMTLAKLLEYGDYIVKEQDNVKKVQLADAYLDGAVLAGSGGSSNPPPSLLA
uniref:Uncharacterized protein n=2 Tax=Eutreptiella gymnastica TaxID=73025 RepID=A0A7S4LG34_9EUGL